MEKKTYVVELLPFEETIGKTENERVGSSLYGVTNDRLNEIINEILKLCDGKDSVYLANVLLEYVDTNKLTFNEVLAMSWGFLNKATQQVTNRGMKGILARLLMEGLIDED